MVAFGKWKVFKCNQIYQTLEFLALKKKSLHEPRAGVKELYSPMAKIWDSTFLMYSMFLLPKTYKNKQELICNMVYYVQSLNYLLFSPLYKSLLTPALGPQRSSFISAL